MAQKPKIKKMITKKNDKERGLGRGLSALMSDISVATEPPQKKTATKKSTANKTQATSASRGGVNVLNIDLLERNPDQPRRYFDKEKLKELTESIRDKGVLQPILVRELPLTRKGTKTRYQIVAGERRWQASLKAGLTAMPALIRDLSDQEVLEIGVVENVQRADLNPVEEAMAYKALQDQFSRTQEDIAKAVGKSRSHIANMLRLLTLPNRARDHLAKGKISTGHARAIIAAPDPVAMAEEIADKGLSVRQAEDWVRRLKSSNTSKAPKAMKDADTRKLEEQLSDALGLVVDLRHKGPGGELRIKYRTADQFDHLLKTLK